MKIKKLSLVLIILLSTTIFVHATPPEEGKTIFINRCAACHNVNKVMTGPALAGIDQRRSLEWITKFIHSSQTLVKSGDKDAVAIFQQFNRVPMPDHADLTSDHIKSIVDFIKSEAKPAGTEKAPFAKPGMKKTAYIPLTIQKDYIFFIGFLLAVGLLIVALLFAVHLKNFQRKMQEPKDAV